MKSIDTKDKNWTAVKLGDVCPTVFSGGTPDTRIPRYWSGDIPWLSSGETRNAFIAETEKKVNEEAINNSSTRWAKKGDVVIASAGQGHTRGQVSFLMIDTLINQSLVVLRPNKDKLDSLFLFYLLRLRYNEIRSKSDCSSTRGSITGPLMKGLSLYIPIEVAKQKEIVEKIFSYDRLIENNEKRIKILEEMTERLYREWFVKLNFPGHEKVRLVYSGTGYGEIPEGWEVKKLGEVVSVVRGCSYSSEEIDDFEGDYYIVNLKSFNRGGGFRFDGAKFYSGDINEDQKLRTGDIVVAVTDMTTDRAVIARPARVPEIDGKVTFSADVVKVNSSVLPNSFLYQLLSTYEFTETTKQMANGANVLHLKPAAILEFETLIPDAKMLEQFDFLCRPSTLEIDKLLKQNDNLSKTRDLLIPQLVTGKRGLQKMA
ncbi:MAG: restriction endonuclease subunit S [Patescibacteria group bacterium]